MTKKVEGVSEDIDVIAVVKAFDAFRDGVQFMSDSADKMTVELQFESSRSKTVHYSFAQDEEIRLKDVTVNPDNNKLMYSVVFGALDKSFYTDEAEVINVHKDGITSLDEALKEEFKKAFDPTTTGLKIGTITALQAMLKNNPPLVGILNDPSKFLEEIEATGSRGKAYSKLEKFGRY